MPFLCVHCDFSSRSQKRMGCHVNSSHNKHNLQIKKNIYDELNNELNSLTDLLNNDQELKTKTKDSEKKNKQITETIENEEESNSLLDLIDELYPISKETDCDSLSQQEVEEDVTNETNNNREIECDKIVEESSNIETEELSETVTDKANNNKCDKGIEGIAHTVNDEEITNVPINSDETLREKPKNNNTIHEEPSVIDETNKTNGSKEIQHKNPEPNVTKQILKERNTNLQAELLNKFGSNIFSHKVVVIINDREIAFCENSKKHKKLKVNPSRCHTRDKINKRLNNVSIINNRDSELNQNSTTSTASEDTISLPGEIEPEVLLQEEDTDVLENIIRNSLERNQVLNRPSNKNQISQQNLPNRSASHNFFNVENNLNPAPPMHFVMPTMRPAPPIINREQFTNPQIIPNTQCNENGINLSQREAILRQQIIQTEQQRIGLLTQEPNNNQRDRSCIERNPMFESSRNLTRMEFRQIPQNSFNDINPNAVFNDAQMNWLASTRMQQMNNRYTQSYQNTSHPPIIEGRAVQNIAIEQQNTALNLTNQKSTSTRVTILDDRTVQTEAMEQDVPLQEMENLLDNIDRNSFEGNSLCDFLSYNRNLIERQAPTNVLSCNKNQNLTNTNVEEQYLNSLSRTENERNRELHYMKNTQMITKNHCKNGMNNSRSIMNSVLNQNNDKYIPKNATIAQDLTVQTEEMRNEIFMQEMENILLDNVNVNSGVNPIEYQTNLMANQEITNQTSHSNKDMNFNLVGVENQVNQRVLSLTNTAVHNEFNLQMETQTNAYSQDEISSLREVLSDNTAAIAVDVAIQEMENSQLDYMIMDSLPSDLMFDPQLNPNISTNQVLTDCSLRINNDLMDGISDNNWLQQQVYPMDVCNTVINKPSGSGEAQGLTNDQPIGLALNNNIQNNIKRLMNQRYCDLNLNNAVEPTGEIVMLNGPMDLALTYDELNLNNQTNQNPNYINTYEHFLNQEQQPPTIRFACPEAECCYKTKSKGNFKAHRYRMHHSLRNVRINKSCPQCDFKTYGTKKLLTHIKKSHPEPEEPDFSLSEAILERISI